MRRLDLSGDCPRGLGFAGLVGRLGAISSGVAGRVRHTSLGWGSSCFVSVLFGDEVVEGVFVVVEPVVTAGAYQGEFIDVGFALNGGVERIGVCLLYTSPSPRDRTRSRMPSSA